MSQFPAWGRQFAAWSDVVQLRQAEFRRIVSELTMRGEETTSEVRAKAVAQVERTRRRCEELPRALVDELRRRVNVLDLATKQDVEVQSKLGRKRLSVVAKEVREANQNHDDDLLRTLRSELREELEIFAAAIADDLFATDEPPPADPRGRRGEIDDELESDDEIDLVSYDDAGFSDDDDDSDLSSGMEMRHSHLDPTDG
jgi:hypothetical protein